MKISEFFTRVEISCKCGCGFDSMDIETLLLADFVRRAVGYPITPSSGCRCYKHNKAVGGADNSQHLRARAVDLPVKNPVQVYDLLCETYPDSYGFGLYETFVHIDTRTDGPKRWIG